MWRVGEGGEAFRSPFVAQHFCLEGAKGGDIVEFRHPPLQDEPRRRPEDREIAPGERIAGARCEGMGRQVVRGIGRQIGQAERGNHPFGERSAIYPLFHLAVSHVYSLSPSVASMRAGIIDNACKGSVKRQRTRNLVFAS